MPNIHKPHPSQPRPRTWLQAYTYGKITFALVLVVSAIVVYTVTGVPVVLPDGMPAVVQIRDFPSEEALSDVDLGVVDDALAAVRATNAEGAAAVSAKAAAVIEAGSGRVLYEKNADFPMPMASTTKVMTALLAIEHGNLDAQVTIPPQAQGVEGSSIWLEAGEHLTLQELLYGLMLSSGNDAATAIAIHIAGDVPAFVDMMNAKAAALGCVNTRFANPHGLSAQGHYTTARELAQITAEAMQHPAFVDLVSTQNATIAWEGHPWKRSLKNKNKLLSTYDGCNGGKTGYTKEAGRCLVETAQRDGMQLVAVVLSAPDWFNDCARMMDDTFAAYQMVEVESALDVRVMSGHAESVPVVFGQPVRLPVVWGEQPEVTLMPVTMLTAPVKAGDTAGHAIVQLAGMQWEVPLVAATDVPGNRFADWFREVIEGFI